MKASMVLILVAAGLSGCATPVTYLKDRATGKVVTCGGGSAGSWLGGMAGYSIEKSNDDDCVAKYEAAGYVPFYPGYDQSSAPGAPPKAGD